MKPYIALCILALLCMGSVADHDHKRLDLANLRKLREVPPLKEEENENENEDEDEDEDNDEMKEIEEVWDNRDEMIDLLEEVACTRAQEYITHWVKSVEDFIDECTNGEQPVFEVLLSPVSHLDSEQVCEKDCLQSIQERKTGTASLAELVFEVCGAPNSDGKGFFETILKMNVTWADVRSNYADLRDKINTCVPPSEDQNKRERCERLITNFKNNLEESGCADDLETLKSQSEAEAFCDEKDNEESCFETLQLELKELVRGGCMSVDYVREMRQRAALVCDQKNGEFCFPVLREFEGSNFWDDLEDAVEEGDLDDANKITEEICSSSCLRSVAKKQWLELDSLAVDLGTLCKRGSNSTFCYTKFSAAMNIENEAERSEALCSDRCFAKIARELFEKAESEELKEFLKGILKYLCKKDSEENDDEEDDGDDLPCVSRVVEAEEELEQVCASAFDGESCSNACLQNFPGWLKKSNCCINTTLSFRSMVLSEGDAQVHIDRWTNLASSCGFEIDPACDFKPRFQKWKGLRLCGISSLLFEDQEILDAFKEDLLANFGINPENLGEVIIKQVENICSKSDRFGRRILQGNVGVQVEFELLGEDEKETEQMFQSASDDELTFHRTLAALADSGETSIDVSASQYEAEAPPTPSSGSRASNNVYLLLLSLALAHL